jgi:Uri superfamily endonuclease
MKDGLSRLALPHVKGCYLLVLCLSTAQQIRVGKLGELTFQAGFYLYVGSALGAGGIAGRLKHHLTSQKRHWHIDFLKSKAVLQEIWYRGTEWGGECQWATELSKFSQLSCPHVGFGASDCRCVAHLFYCPEPTALLSVRAAMQETSRILVLP